MGATTPDGWQLVVPMEELVRAGVVARWVGNAEILCVHEGGETHVWSNVCPHKMGPLADGRIGGHEVTCPWHDWTFDLRSGRIRCDAPSGPLSSITATPEQLRRIRELRLRPVPHRVDAGGVWVKQGFDAVAAREAS